MAAAAVPARMVTVAVTSLAILGLVRPCGLSPLVFSLIGRAVAVVGMMVLAGAGRVAGRLLLAPG